MPLPQRAYLAKCLRILSLLLLTTLIPAITRAQTLTAPYPGTGVITTTGVWRFHTGDDLRWLTPTFDDSSWEYLSADSPWGAQTHPDYTGYAWYRRSIQITGITGPLSIYLPPIDSAYELYFNGQRIGGFGHFPPQAVWFQRPQDNIFPLPDAGFAGELSGVLSIRVWRPMLASTDPSDGGGLTAAPFLGDSEVLKHNLDLSETRYVRTNLLQIMVDFIFFLVAVGALLRWAFDRTQKLQLWLGVFALGFAVQLLVYLPSFYRYVPFITEQLYENLRSAASDLGSWMLILILFGLDQVKLWRRITAIFATIYLLTDAIDFTALVYWTSGWLPLRTVDSVTAVISSILPAFAFVLLAAGLRRRREPALIVFSLAYAILLCQLVGSAVAQLPAFTRLPGFTLLAEGSLHLGMYSLDLNSLLRFIVLIAIIYREQARERRRQLFVESELNSAREIQHVLVPEETQPIPGFAISSLYWPAGEVGGDMFQVIPEPNGGVLIVLADVSGKGLKAAMTVSLLVGAVRTIADLSTNPLTILTTLNQRLLGRGDGGFCTCLALHITANGLVTLANAGHLPPYFNGQPLPIEGSLPLGLVAAQDFPITHLQLEECDDLTLYTDGVLEAQSPAGELFGFDRTEQLFHPRPSVLTIAQAARTFGQTDDITVIKIVRNPSRDSLTHIPADLASIPA